MSKKEILEEYNNQIEQLKLLINTDENNYQENRDKKKIIDQDINKLLSRTYRGNAEKKKKEFESGIIASGGISRKLPNNKPNPDGIPNFITNVEKTLSKIQELKTEIELHPLIRLRWTTKWTTITGGVLGIISIITATIRLWGYIRSVFLK